MKYTKEVIDLIRETPELQNLLAAAAKVSQRTVQRWVEDFEDQDPKLTMMACYEVIANFTKWNKWAILQKEETKVA